MPAAISNMSRTPVQSPRISSPRRPVEKASPAPSSATAQPPTRQSRSSAPPADNEIAIAVMGATGSGKSTFINLVSGSELMVGNGLRSCTSSVNTSNTFEVSGRRITLVDTPGFDDTTKSDTDILKMIAVYLATTYEDGKKLTGVIYLHRISDVRMTGVSRRNFAMFRKLCGDEALKNVSIVTTMWSEVDEQRGANRELQLATEDILFKTVINLGAKLLRHDNTYESAAKIVLNIASKKPMVLRIQQELVDEHKNISETEAGMELDQELAELARKHREELAQVVEEMQEAVAAKDSQTQAELEQVCSELTANIERLDRDRDRISREYAEEKKRANAKVQEVRTALQAEETARAQRQVEIDRLKARVASQAEAEGRAQLQADTDRSQTRAAIRVEEAGRDRRQSEATRQSHQARITLQTEETVRARRRSEVDSTQAIMRGNTSASVVERQHAIQQINILQQQQVRGDGPFCRLGRALDRLFGWTY